MTMYQDSKRIVKLSTDAVETTAYETDFSSSTGWTTSNSSKVDIDTSANELQIKENGGTLAQMYYDLGSSSFKVTAKDVIKDDLNSYIVATTGTINRDISGYGLGIVGAVDVDIASYLNMSYYAKVGAHNWERSGSTTLLDNNAAFKSRFYDDGIGAYGSLGVAANFTDNIGLNISYHSMGLSNDVSFGNSSSLTSAGLRFKF